MKQFTEKKIDYQMLDDVYEKFSYDFQHNVYLGTIKNLFTGRTWHIFATSCRQENCYLEGYDRINNFSEALQLKLTKLVSYCNEARNKKQLDELDVFCLRDPAGPGFSDSALFVPVGNVLDELSIAVSKLELSLIDL